MEQPSTVGWNALTMEGVAGEIPDDGSIRRRLHLPCVRTHDAVHSRAGTICDRCFTNAIPWIRPASVTSSVSGRAGRPLLIRKLVLRGIERGGIRSDVNSPFVVDVIPAMLMYRAQVCGSE
ncbi:hypothetical protein [Streptomyces sp. NPDC059979]|uniref:hypothetical protein n=1 Tax=Streptomyces sp. NPDC059979 TaxID=3347021 RepID=UPI0036CCEB20